MQWHFSLIFACYVRHLVYIYDICTGIEGGRPVALHAWSKEGTKIGKMQGKHITVCHFGCGNVAHAHTTTTVRWKSCQSPSVWCDLACPCSTLRISVTGCYFAGACRMSVGQRELDINFETIRNLIASCMLLPLVGTGRVFSLLSLCTAKQAAASPRFCAIPPKLFSELPVRRVPRGPQKILPRIGTTSPKLPPALSRCGK